MIALIDVDSLIYYVAAKEDQPEENSWEKVRYAFHQRVDDILKRTESQEFLLLYGKGKNFRHDFAKTFKYKGNRKVNKAQPLLAALKNYVEFLPYTFVCNGIEADDAVSILSNEIKVPTIICSPDKDVLQQCVGVHYNYGKDEFISTNEEEAKHFLALQSIMGDSTDDIKGIEGVGIVGATKKLEAGQTPLEAYIEKYGNLLGTLYYSENYSLVYLLKSFTELQLINQNTYEELKQVKFYKSDEFHKERENIDSQQESGMYN